MKYKLETHIEKLEFQLWDPDTDDPERMTTTAVEADEIEAFITQVAEEDPAKACRIIVDSMRGFVEDLKTELVRDLVDCFERDD